MQVLKIVLTSIGSVAMLFVLTKIMGNRQMSQMSMFDYINGITIGSIAAEFATSLEGDFVKPLTAMVVYGVLAALISFLTCKSMPLRRLFNGKPIVLYENGTLYEKNLSKARLDVNEFLTQCRIGGFFDLSQLQTAILETNGQISLMPTASTRPVTPEDLQMQLPLETPAVCVIIDGVVLNDNLRHTGNNDTWLKNQLAAQHAKASEVFLALVDNQNTLTLYRKTGEQVKRDMFE